MLNNVKLIATQDFNDISCDFFKDINEEYLVTREQIGTALGYKNPSKAIEQIHMKHRDRLDKFSCLIKSTIDRPLHSEGNNPTGYSSRGAIQERTFYNRKGVMEICRWSRQPLADKFMDWVWDVIDGLMKEQSAKTQSELVNISPQLAVLLQENKYIKNKLNRLENMITSLLPPTKHSHWKSEIGKKIKTIATTLGIADAEIKSIYGNIYNKMRNDYGMDINNYTADYLLNHKEVANPPAIDIVDEYDELRELFEAIVDNYVTLESETNIDA